MKRQNDEIEEVDMVDETIEEVETEETPKSGSKVGAIKKHAKTIAKGILAACGCIVLGVLLTSKSKKGGNDVIDNYDNDVIDNASEIADMSEENPEE